MVHDKDNGGIKWVGSPPAEWHKFQPPLVSTATTSEKQNSKLHGKGHQWHVTGGNNDDNDEDNVVTEETHCSLCHVRCHRGV